jgi:hypothetical protein
MIDREIAYEKAEEIARDKAEDIAKEAYHDTYVRTYHETLNEVLLELLSANDDDYVMDDMERIRELHNHVGLSDDAIAQDVGWPVSEVRQLVGIIDASLALVGQSMRRHLGVVKKTTDADDN